MNAAAGRSTLLKFEMVNPEILRLLSPLWLTDQLRLCLLLAGSSCRRCQKRRMFEKQHANSITNTPNSDPATPLAYQCGTYTEARMPATWGPQYPKKLHCPQRYLGVTIKSKNASCSYHTAATVSACHVSAPQRPLSFVTSLWWSFTGSFDTFAQYDSSGGE
jgi:hypothetical protein